MKASLIVLALLIPMRAWAFCDDWKTQDSILEISLAVMGYYDSYDTSHCLRRGTCEEANPYLGKHPTDDQLYGLTTALIAGHLAIACFLPGAARTTWQIGAIAFEYLILKNNGALATGLKINF